MQDLRATSGLPLRLADDGSLVFGGGLPAVEPAVRTLDAMREVLADPAAQGPAQLYFMYRDVAWPADRAAIAAAGLRYDLTVVLPGKLGSELAKTYGHYHPLAPDGQFYPEVYEVIYGRAIYVLQRRGPEGRVDDVLAIHAGPGDKVFMLPGYGHVTVNPGDTPLVMANWVAAAFSSDYTEYRRLRGAAYYALAGGAVSWRPNPQYGPLPPLREAAPRCPEDLTALQAGRPMYADGVAHAQRLRYLVEPSAFRGNWARLVG